MTHSIKNHTKLLEKAFSHTVVRYGEFTFQVTSGTSGETYWTTLRANGEDRAGCTCPRQKYIGTLKNGGQNFCSHVQAVIVHVLAEEGYVVTTRPADAPVKNLHRKVVDLGVGDNVKITVRKDGNPIRKLRKLIEDDRSYADRLEAGVRLNAVAFGLDPDLAVQAVEQEKAYA